MGDGDHLTTNQTAAGGRGSIGEEINSALIGEKSISFDPKPPVQHLCLSSYLLPWGNRKN